MKINKKKKSKILKSFLKKLTQDIVTYLMLNLIKMKQEMEIFYVVVLNLYFFYQVFEENFLMFL